MNGCLTLLSNGFLGQPLSPTAKRTQVRHSGLQTPVCLLVFLAIILLKVNGACPEVSANWLVNTGSSGYPVANP